MTPVPPTPGPGGGSRLSGMDLDEACARWLADPEAKGVPEVLHRPALAWFATQEAIAEALSHEACLPDPRDFNVRIMVVGEDGVAAYYDLAPEHSVSCVTGVLSKDPRVRGLRVLGVVRPAPPIPAPEPNPGVVVHSGLVVHDTPRPAHMTMRRSSWARDLFTRWRTLLRRHNNTAGGNQ